MPKTCPIANVFLDIRLQYSTGFEDLWLWHTPKIKEEGWGKGTAQSLAKHIQGTRLGLRFFPPQNLWRISQSYDTYRYELILSTLLRELAWSANLHILSRAKRPEERALYIRMASKNRWPVREFARQMDAGLFECNIHGQDS